MGNIPSGLETFGQAIATPLALVFLFLALLHVHWAFGGKFGSLAAVPERPGGIGADGRPVMVKAFQPSRLGTLVVAGGLTGVATLVALRSGLLGAPPSHWTIRIALSLAALGMLARAVGDFTLVGFFKSVRGSRFARMDTILYSPLCVLLGLGLGLVAGF